MAEVSQTEQYSKPFGKGKPKGRNTAAKEPESKPAEIKKMPKWK